MKFLYKIGFVILTISILLSSCSRKKNGFTRRAYHNTTSHYNYYFNAREIIRGYEASVETGTKDDYNYILPIFKYGSEDQAKGAYEDMDEVIKKCSRLIDRHAMYIKKEEYNRWIDLSYLLVGKAKFYKQEYYGAIEIYEYIELVFKGKPSFYESQLWRARCYMEMGDFRESRRILEEIKESQVPEELKGEYFAVYADLEVKTDHNELAAALLKQSIDNTKKLKIRRRYTYILAQLYHDRKDYKNATTYYGKVLKMRPDYVMAFNAKLNQARSYDPSANNSEDIKKRLNRMLRDKKNLEFRDQIYFALAEMAFREGDEELGMEYLRLSASSSMGNNKVKSEAYMLLGDIYFDKPKYILSHSYYDSSLTIMPENHPKIETIKERKESLDELVANLIVIQTEDSLQMVASMDEKDRNKKIAKLIREVEAKEEQERLDLERGFAQSYQLANKRGDQDQVGQWYFYNQNSKSFGVSEFSKQWGERKLEDNWRRRNKNTIAVFKEEADEAAADSTADKIDEKDPEFYLAKLPLDDSSLAASHNKIIAALYNAGNYYREDFMDYQNAIETFDRLVNQYDTSHLVPSAYYQLYRIYLLTEESSKAAEYKAKLLKEYPFSEYATIIKNPSFLKNRRDKKQQVEAYYRATYQLYDYQLYDDVLEACWKSDSLFGKHHLKPQFDYLKALAIGKSKTKRDFRIALEGVVAVHPTEDVGKAAQEILNKMSEERAEKQKREALYKKNFRDEQIFVVMVPNQSNIVNSVKTIISNYNIGNTAELGEKDLTAVKFDAEYQMISVKSFDNKDAGMKYIQNIQRYPDFDNQVVQKQYEFFIISLENYAYFYKDKDMKSYLSFYNDHYLN